MDDLVKRLREIESNHSGWGYAAIAASRIEELEAKLGEYNLLWQTYELDKALAELKGQNDD
jgi:hypothetical protein